MNPKEIENPIAEQDFKIQFFKEKLREEYETQTGKKHGNPLFFTNDYACWLEKRILKLNRELRQKP